MKITIQAPGMDLTPSIKEYVNEKIGLLDKYLKNEKMVGALVEVERLVEGHHRQGDVFRVQVNLKIGGDTLRVEETKESLQTAVDFVRDELSREIKQRKEKKQDISLRKARSWKKSLRLDPSSRFKQ